VTTALSASRWANDLTLLLDEIFVGGADRFPVQVPMVARDFSAQRFAGDAITLVKGASLHGFEGALYRAPAGKQGWGIIYNNAIASPGRVNFTLAHEFGHYLLHRLAYPNGIECGQQDMVRWDNSYRVIEQQANCFAAGLLMPFHDFRAQIAARAKPSLEELSACAQRYGVSLIAATLRWLEYAERRSVLVVSRDGYILWARSSKSALRTGAYFKTVGRSAISVPTASLAARAAFDEAIMTAEHDTAWFGEPSIEISLASDHYDFVLSLIHLEEAAWRQGDELEEVGDVFDRISGNGT
jgi:hypothetical protein